MTAVAATAGVAAYLDARFHLSKDISSIISARKTEQLIPNAVLNKRESLLNFFLDQVALMPADEECIWTPQGSLTWQETYEMAARYASFLREELGVAQDELVGFYLTNGVPYVVSLLATWGIGTAPAQLNYNLGGDALLHCVRVAGCKVLLVDEDVEVQARIAEVRGKLEEMGIRIVVLDEARRTQIQAREPLWFTPELRSNVKITSTLMLIYTRSVKVHLIAILLGGN